jgi:hypothetical protein
MGKVLSIPATMIRLPAHRPNINRATKQAKKDLERRLGRKIGRREFAVLLKTFA